MEGESSCAICGGVFYTISKKDGRQHHRMYTGSHGIACHIECLKVLERFLDNNFRKEAQHIEYLEQKEAERRNEKHIAMRDLAMKIRKITGVGGVHIGTRY